MNFLLCTSDPTILSPFSIFMWFVFGWGFWAYKWKAVHINNSFAYPMSQARYTHNSGENFSPEIILFCWNPESIASSLLSQQGDNNDNSTDKVHQFHRNTLCSFSHSEFNFAFGTCLQRFYWTGMGVHFFLLSGKECLSHYKFYSAQAVVTLTFVFKWMEKFEGFSQERFQSSVMLTCYGNKSAIWHK